mmetsp:Transcript_35220/g.64332  ORF Transcript_35220/g.64332 Transcript_35220/m.64332 type:complete len:337 (-) Transcript_35220:121-1131(-)
MLCWLLTLIALGLRFHLVHAQLCDAPQGVEHASEQPCLEGDIIFAGTCTASCVYGYNPEPATLTCSGSTFVEGTFKCVGWDAPCTSPVSSDISNSQEMPCIEGESIEHLGNCTASCVEGYTPTEEALQCIHGAFEPLVFECLPSRCNAPTWQFSSNLCAEGSYIEHSHNCTARCLDDDVPSVASLLCEYGKLNPTSFVCRSPWDANTTERSVSVSSMTGNAANLDSLLKMGADPDANMATGSRALHFSVLRRDIAATQLLLDAKADPDVVDPAGWTPLHLAAAQGDSTLVAMLLSHGADMQIRDETGSLARDYARSDVISVLLKAELAAIGMQPET